MDTLSGKPAMQNRYARARQHAPDGQAIAVLHLAGEETLLALGRGANADALITFSFGAGGLARRLFKHSPPAPFDLENAITVVEDEIAQKTQGVDGQHFHLVSSDSVTGGFARLAGLAETEGPRIMSREALERLFGRLASVAEGQPASYADIPDDNEFAAALLILRELMHHLQFQEIVLLPPGAARPARSSR